MKTLVLAGPSQVGKTTIIKKLIELNPNFYKITYYTTRGRSNEADDKIHVTSSDFEGMDNRGKFLLKYEMYGHRYGMLREDFQTPSKGKFPVLDFPMVKLKLLETAISEVFKVLVFPPNWDVIRDRFLASGRDPSGARYEYDKEKFYEWVNYEWDLLVCNDLGRVEEVAQRILTEFFRNP